MESVVCCKLEDDLEISPLVLPLYQSSVISIRFDPMQAILTFPMPNDDLHLQLQKWAHKYGPIYSLILGTQILIILSSPEAIKELLDKRSNIYSSRPNLYISQNLISGGNRMVLMKYDERWRMIRKMCHSLLNVQAARTYVPYQLLESKQMLNDLLDTPDDFVNHMRR